MIKNLMALTFYKETLMLRSWKVLVKLPRQARAVKIINTLVRHHMREAFAQMRSNLSNSDETLVRFISYKHRTLKQKIIRSWIKYLVQKKIATLFFMKKYVKAF